MARMASVPLTPSVAHGKSTDLLEVPNVFVGKDVATVDNQCMEQHPDVTSFEAQAVHFVFDQARSQGGFGGCGRTPIFLGPIKKKSMVSAFGSCMFRVRSRLHAPPYM